MYFLRFLQYYYVTALVKRNFTTVMLLKKTKVKKISKNRSTEGCSKFKVRQQQYKFGRDPFQSQS